MLNFINRELADVRDVPTVNQDRLNSLHYLLTVLEEFHKTEGPWNDKAQQNLLDVVQTVEYLMQELWGFSQRAEKHTHFNRFDVDIDGYNAWLESESSETPISLTKETDT